jgi:type VI secretion system secreted protein VgrG
VQYRESDFDFASRLLEEEGIAYWFREEADGGPATLVLADRAEAYWSCADRELHRRSATGSGEAGDDFLDWRHTWEHRSARWVQRDFDFKRPNLSLEAQRSADLVVPSPSALEIYEYPGGYSRRDEGDRITRARAQLEECACEVVRGASRFPFLAAGGKFAVGRHVVTGEKGRTWAVVEIEHEVMGGAEVEVEREFETPVPYINRFRCIPEERTFRPERKTPKPRIQGVQTATVVGPKGEEIHVDRFGRIKVQFHWDRYGQRNEQSSCWIRVSQPWAGAGYGGLAVPRIGQEVIVEFEEGDPDRPLINGRLYNGANAVPASHAGRDPKKMPAPKDVREAAMMTSIRSQSLGGSGGSNEITMNDSGGAEGLFIKAQKDEIHVVGNDRSDTVGHDETREVGNDRTRKVGNNETVEVGANRSRLVGGNEKIEVAGSRTETVGGMEMYTVNGARAHTVMVAENITNGVSRSLQTGLAHIEVVGLLNTVMTGMARVSVIGASDTSMVLGGSALHKAGTSYTIKAGTDASIEAAGNMGLKAASMLVIECPDITLKAGGGFIRINSEGVTIVGSKVKVNSGGSAGSLPEAAEMPAAAGSGATGGAGSVGSSGGLTGVAGSSGGLIGSETAEVLKKIGQSLKGIPGIKLPSTFDNVINALSGGTPMNLGALLDMVPSEYLSKDAQQALANVKQANDAFTRAEQERENKTRRQATGTTVTPSSGGVPSSATGGGGGPKYLTDPSSTGGSGTPTPSAGGAKEVSAEDGQKVADKSAELANDYTQRSVKYGWGKSAADGGTESDCSHFVQHAMKKSGIDVPYESTSTIGSSTAYTEIPADQARAGDVIVQGGHMGIYTGRNDGRGRPIAVQMGEGGAREGMFGPDGWFNKDQPMKVHRPKRGG